MRIYDKTIVAKVNNIKCKFTQKKTKFLIKYHCLFIILKVLLKIKLNLSQLNESLF